MRFRCKRIFPIKRCCDTIVHLIGMWLFYAVILFYFIIAYLTYLYQSYFFMQSGILYSWLHDRALLEPPFIQVSFCVFSQNHSSVPTTKINHSPPPHLAPSKVLPAPHRGGRVNGGPSGLLANAGGIFVNKRIQNVHLCRLLTLLKISSINICNSSDWRMVVNT